MRFRFPPLFVFLLLFGASVCNAQTATCTNWRFFKAPAPWSGLSPKGINRWGTVVGVTYLPRIGPAPTFIKYGFVRYSDGSFKTYMAPNAVQTGFYRRNKLGVTVGFYSDSSGGTHGLAVSGTSQATVDYPGKAGTVLLGINNWGTIVGNSSTAFKLKNGTFTPIFYPGSVQTGVTSISDKGVKIGISKLYQPPYLHGFTLVNGVYKTLDHPKSTEGTFLNDINGSGVIVDSYENAGNSFGFIYINGVFKDVKGPNGQASSVAGINGYGDITGTAVPGVAFTAHCQ
jgi:hypothetical protein